MDALSDIFDAIFYLIRTGWQWHAVFPIWNCFITISPNERTTVSLNKYLKLFAS